MEAPFKKFEVQYGAYNQFAVTVYLVDPTKKNKDIEQFIREAIEEKMERGR